MEINSIQEQNKKIENAAFSLQKEILDRVFKSLENDFEDLWLFVHLRSIAVTKKGRTSAFRAVKCENEMKKIIEDSLEFQYQIERGLRTYNELLTSTSTAESRHGNLRKLAFCFGGEVVTTLPGVDEKVIHFDDKTIEELTNGETFNSLMADKNSSKIREIGLSRQGLGLKKKIRNHFNLEKDEDNFLRALPDEVRYSLQVLMLWSKTCNWKYIYTFHSTTKFDALSGLVFTIASKNKELNEEAVNSIENTLRSFEHQVEDLGRKKFAMIEKYFRETSLIPTAQKVGEDYKQYKVNNLFSKLAINISIEDYTEINGFVTYNILGVLLALFTSTFESNPESYTFILGHPGFIARPYEIESNPKISFADIGKYREFCEGGIDRLNIVDLFDEAKVELKNCYITPVAFPVWSRYGTDYEQEYMFSLSVLSSVHREMIVVGISCRNIATIFKAGELILTFNGRWQEILSWEEISNHLELPTDLLENKWIKQIYQTLINIAYGNCPRSIILTYTLNTESRDTLAEMSQTIGHDKEELNHFRREITNFEDFKNVIFPATKTDGAILIYEDENLEVIYKQRVTVDDQNSANSTGTGDSTASAIADKLKEILAFKVSQDGGLKVNWSNKKIQAHIPF